MLREVFYGVVLTELDSINCLETLVKDNAEFRNDDFDHLWRAQAHRELWDSILCSDVLPEEMQWTRDLFLKPILDNPYEYKVLLYERFDPPSYVDRHTLKQLIERIQPVYEEKKRIEKEMHEQFDFSEAQSTQRDNQPRTFDPALEQRKEKNDRQWHYLRIAFLVKIAEKIHGLRVNLDDFAAILTSHPTSMTRYWMPFHFLREQWTTIQQTRDGHPPHHTYNMYRQQIETDPYSVLADFLLAEAPIEVDEYRRLQSHPWIQQEFGSNYEHFLHLYQRYYNQFQKEWKNSRRKSDRS